MVLRASRCLCVTAVCAVAGLLGTFAQAQKTIRVPQDQPTIQAGIDAAHDGDFVYVSPGTYNGAITFKGKAIELVSTGGAGSTIIDGNGQGEPIVMIPSASTANFTSLVGFTIRDGTAPASGFAGAVQVAAAGAYVGNNTIVGAYCAGIAATNASLQIVGNSISGTSATGCATAEGVGSAIAIAGSSATPTSITGNILSHNLASVAAASDKGGGAAINVTGANEVDIYSNVMSNNVSTGYGGAVYIAGTPVIYLRDNVIFSNKGLSGGLDIVVPGSSVGDLKGILYNNTIVANMGIGTGANVASDLYIGGNLAQYALVNNIIGGYANGQSAVNCGAAYAGQTLTPLIFDHNDIYSLAGTTNTPVGGACTSPTGSFGNISADPFFVNGTPAALVAGTQNFHLVMGSPAIDTGTNAVVDTHGPLLDLDGNNRSQDATGRGYMVADMGAYEAAGVLDAQATILRLEPSSYTPVAGVSFTLTATYAYYGGPNGPITLYEDGVANSTGIISANTVSFVLANGLTAGLHSFYVVVPATGGYAPSTSIPLYVRTGTAMTTTTMTTLTSSLNPSSVGQSVTLTAHVAASGNVPTGTVNFSDGAVTIGSVAVDASGNAALVTAALAQGSHSLVASFVPGTGYVGSSASLTQVVNGAVAMAVLTVSPGSGAAGVTQTLSARVGSATGASPTGTVAFYNNAALIGTATLSATTTTPVATLTATLPVGSDSITCVYMGDSIYASASCSAVLVTITAIPTATVLSVAPAGATAGTPLTLAATVSATNNAAGFPTGTVTFYADGATLGTTALNGSTSTATLVATLNAGPHVLGCVYSGDMTYASSTCTAVPLTLSLAPTSLTLASAANPTPALAPVNFRAHLTLSSGGTAVAGATVTFTIDSAMAGTAFTDASGNALYTSPGLTAGTHAVAASFAADAQRSGSGSMIVSEVAYTNATSTTLIGQPNPGTQNQPVTLVASVAALTGTVAPVGTVQFSEGSGVLAVYPLQAPASGVVANATLVISTPAPGTHVITATYAPSMSVPYLGAFSASAPATLTVTIAPQSFSIKPTSPTLTIQTEHHGSVGVSLTSVGGLTGVFALSCGSLPDYATCEFAQTTVALPANGTVTANLTIDTDVILGFKSSLDQREQRQFGWVQDASLASLLPLGLVAFALRRRRFARLLLLALLAATGLGLTGCSGKYPAHTAPGTYTVRLKATGLPAGSTASQTQTADLTLIVTP